MNEDNSLFIKIKNLFLFILKIIKMIITYIIKLILSLFKNKNEQKNENINIKINKSNSKDINNYPLPNEDNIKNNNNIITNNSITIKKKKIDEIKTKTKNTAYYFSEEFLINTFNEIIKEEKEKKNISIPIEKKEITKLKEIIIPKIQRNISKNEIKSKNDLKKEITNEIKIQQLKKEIYFIATPLKTETKLPKTNKISKQNNKVKVIEKKESKIIKEKLERSPIIMVPLTKEKPKIKLKDETTNLVNAASLIAANFVKEIAEIPKQKEEEIFEKKIKKIKETEEKNFTPKTEEKILKNLSKEINKNSKNINIDVELQKSNNISEKKTDSTLQKERQTISKNKNKSSNEVVLKNITIKTVEPEIKNKYQIIKAVTADDKNKKEIKEQKIKETKQTGFIQEINNEKDEKIETLTKISSSLLDKINQTIIISKEEMKKEEIEEKKYDEVNNKINELLYDLEIYIIQNEKRLMPKQLQILKDEKRNLQNAKQNISVQKKLDIQKEQKNLNELITYDELNNLQLELKKLHLENQLDINNYLLNQIEDIEKLTVLQVEEIEKKLIKQKLKKASQTMEISSIFALPFIRNKYFFFFTIGLCVNNHFNFLHHIFKRKTKNYSPIDLTTLRNGQDALNNALNLTAENIMYLEYLEQEALSKYPDLATDEEYLKYINKLKTSLNKNYQKLQKKHIILNKYCKKANKHIKILKRNERKQSA